MTLADTKAPPEGGSSGLDNFLNEATKFVEGVLQDIVRAVGDHDDAPLIVSHGVALQAQFANVATHVRETVTAGSADARRQVDDLMRVQAVTLMAQTGRAAFRTTAASGRFGDGIFAWIESHFEEIKKIIEMIAELLKVGDWFKGLLQVIDQILKLILGLLGRILGRSQARISEELSAMEVQFWNEIGARKRANLISDRNLDPDRD